MFHLLSIQVHVSQIGPPSSGCMSLAQGHFSEKAKGLPPPCAECAQNTYGSRRFQCPSAVWSTAGPRLFESQPARVPQLGIPVRRTCTRGFRIIKHNYRLGGSNGGSHVMRVRHCQIADANTVQLNTQNSQVFLPDHSGMLPNRPLLCEGSRRAYRETQFVPLKVHVLGLGPMIK